VTCVEKICLIFDVCFDSSFTSRFSAEGIDHVNCYQTLSGYPDPLLHSYITHSRRIDRVRPFGREAVFPICSSAQYKARMQELDRVDQESPVVTFKQHAPPPTYTADSAIYAAQWV
jgi:hypothetical protein